MPIALSLSGAARARHYRPMPTAAPRSHLVGLAVLSLRVTPGQPLTRLIPAGQFDAPRGSMSGAGPWNLTAAAAARLIAINAVRQADIAVDYEHQLLASADNGKEAPASGWINPRSLVWVDAGDEPGLYGQVDWTAKAKAMIDADEYRYLSPVFTYSATTHEPIDLMHVALTNFPAIDEPIRAALSARSALTHHQEQHHVNETLKKLLAQLGLPDTTTEGDALAGVAALKAKADLQGTEIAALKAATGAAPDPAKFVPVETMQAMQTQVAALSARINGDDASRLIEAAITDGKLVEAQRTWAADLGKTNLAALKAYVDTAPSIAALKGMQSGGKQGDAGAGGSLSDSELAVCRAMGLSETDYLKSKETK